MPYRAKRKKKIALALKKKPAIRVRFFLNKKFSAPQEEFHAPGIFFLKEKKKKNNFFLCYAYRKGCHW